MKGKFQDNSFSFVVAEDDMIMQKMIVSALKTIGYKNIYTAYDGHDAWDIIENRQIDIILSDLTMPRVNGVELLANVRSSDEHWHIPFIMISSESRKSHIMHSTEDEIDAYIVKPITTNTLEKYVGEVLTNRYDPDLYHSALHLAKSKLRSGNKDEALVAFQEANAYNDNRTSPYFYMAQILEEFNQYELAIQNYEQCDDKSNSLYVRAFDGLSRIYLKNENYEAATEALKKAVDASPANTQRTIELGKCYYKIGDMESSKRYLTEASLMVGDDIEKIEEIAKICFQYNFLDEAENILKKVYDEGVKELKVFNQFGLMSKERKEFEKARTYYNAALQISPNSDVVNYNCAVLFVEMKEYHLAIAHLKRALLHHSEFKAGQDLLDKVEEFIASGKLNNDLVIDSNDSGQQ